MNILPFGMYIQRYQAIFFVLFSSSSIAFAQSRPAWIGAAGNALAYSTICISNEWSLFNNPGALGDLKQSKIAATQNVYPQLEGANRIAAIYSQPIPAGTFSFGIYRFGDPLYSEHILCLGAGHRFGLAAIGANIAYNQFSIEGFGSKGLFTVSLGGVAHLTEKLSIGALLTNITQTRLTKEDGEILPIEGVVGFSFAAGEQLTFNIQCEKDLTYHAVWRSGISFTPVKKIIFRTGYSLFPDTAYFGMGFMPGRLSVDYALEYNPLISIGHQASIAYQLSKK